MKLLWLESLNSNEMALSLRFFKKLNQPEIIHLHFGTLRIKLNPVINNELNDETIGLSKNLNSKYTIPTDIPYAVYCEAGDFFLGPVIAYVSRGDFKKLKKQKYIEILPLYLDYYSIKGVIIICSENSIDIDSGIIRGYYLNGNVNSKKNLWKHGYFPLPNAIFNHSLMSQEKISAIQRKIGDKLFNTYWLNLDKWETWKLLSKNSLLKNHLPYTEEFSNINQLKNLLDNYGSIYLKPTKRARGLGIMKLDKLDTGIALVNYRREKYYFYDYQNLSQYLNNEFNMPYIIQQSVHFISNHQHVDFRLILQRNESKEWALSGLVTRVAHKGSIITNKQEREKSIIGREALTTIFKVSEIEAERIEKEMTQIVINAAEMYENFHLGDVAADIALDSNLNIWLLELQLNYGLNKGSTVLPNYFIRKLITTPFRYAKALAGFKD